MMVHQDFDDYLETARSLLSGYENVSDLWEANDCINQALRLRPRDSSAWILKSQTMSSLEDDASALSAIEMALRFDTANAEAHYVRAAVLGDMERCEDALEALEQAFESVDDETEWLLEDLFYEKAAMLDALGRAEDALQTFESGLKRFPDLVLLRSGIEPLRRERLRQQLRVIEGGRSEKKVG